MHLLLLTQFLIIKCVVENVLLTNRVLLYWMMSSHITRIRQPLKWCRVPRQWVARCQEWTHASVMTSMTPHPVFPLSQSLCLLRLLVFCKAGAGCSSLPTLSAILMAQRTIYMLISLSLYPFNGWIIFIVCKYTTLCLSVPLLTDTLVVSTFLVNNNAMNIPVPISFCVLALNSFDTYLEQNGWVIWQLYV